jgi:prepilin-type N-terminal cleavage/methylation domain-containing protein
MRSAFTLVELLVVIFIIALLSVLILGAVHYAQRSSRISKTKADLAAITTALEQYHSDFRTYPGLPDPPAGALMRHTVLAQALIGPGNEQEDGLNGPGFRVGIDVTTGTVDTNSKKWDPYLSPEHFKFQRFANGWALLDYFGNPIRYLPQRRNLNTKSPNSLVDSPPPGTPSSCIFDARDSEHPQKGTIDLNVDTLQVLVGDLNNNNFIDGQESFAVEGNFILASSGPDGFFTTYVAKEAMSVRSEKSNKSDDIFNFEHR